MPRLRRAVLLLSVGLLSRPAKTQVVPDEPRITFFSARFATWSSRTLSVGYGADAWAVVLGLAQNPRTDYHEALVGVGRVAVIAPQERVTVVVAAADASDARYSELLLAPSLSAGPLAVTGTLKFYAPLEAAGRFQYYANPLSAHLALDPHLRVGVTFVLSGKAGTETGEAIGPSLRLVVPHGAVTFDWVRGLKAYGNETRLTLQAAY